MNRTVRTLTLTAWGILVVTRLWLFIAAALPVWVQLLPWLISLGALFWLLVIYNRQVAQWRVVIAIWLAYSSLRWLVTRLPADSDLILSRNLAEPGDGPDPGYAHLGFCWSGASGDPA